MRSPHRWFVWAIATAFLAVTLVATQAAPITGPSTTPSGQIADHHGPDPQNDPVHGAAHRQLPGGVAGWGSNQNGSQFPHYGRAEIKVCELPRAWSSWTDARQRTWCRAELVRQGHAMPMNFTNHELVETLADGTKVLAVYKVSRHDHASSGRPRLYHPPDPMHPGTNRYYGGIAQLRRLARHHFRPRRPPRRPAGGAPVVYSVLPDGGMADSSVLDAPWYDAPWYPDAGPPDAPPDASPDAPADASPDAPPDASPDAPTDAAEDAPTDGPDDAPTDGPDDGPTDGCVDMCVISEGCARTPEEAGDWCGEEPGWCGESCP